MRIKKEKKKSISVYVDDVKRDRIINLCTLISEDMSTMINTLIDKELKKNNL